MNEEFHHSKEFRFKSGSAILDYVRRFSATEKTVFGILIIIALVTALLMAARANDLFMVKVPAAGGTLTEGEIGLPRTINPVLAISDVDRDISALVYSGLMRYKNGALEPDLALSYAISADGLTYDFKLRPDLHFQDGTPLTADDVVFTVQKIQDPVLKSPRASDWANVTAKAVSPSEVRFVLKQAYSPFLVNTTVGIIPKHIWNDVGDDQFIFSKYNTEPTGSGPYKVTNIRKDSSGVPVDYGLETWSGYYGKMPFLQSIIFVFFPDQEKAVAALDVGSVDSLPSISSAEAVRLASNAAEPYTVVSSPLPRVFGVFFNQNQNTALADKNVRQALNMVVDRDAVVKTVLNGYGSPLYGPLPAGFLDAGISSSTSAGYSLITAAGSLLSKSGWKKDPITGTYSKKSGKNASTTLSLNLYTADTPDLKKTADIVKDAWTSLGAQVEVKIFSPSDLYQNVIAPRKYDALLFGEQIGKDQDMYAFWHSSERNAPGLNVAMYANIKTDKLLETIRTSKDEPARSAAYAEFEELIRADAPAVFLYSPDFIYAIPKTLQNFSLISIASPADRFNSVGDWYLKTEKVWGAFINDQSANRI